MRTNNSNPQRTMHTTVTTQSGHVHIDVASDPALLTAIAPGTAERADPNVSAGAERASNPSFNTLDHSGAKKTPTNQCEKEPERTIPDLPPFIKSSTKDFIWGCLNGDDFACAIHSAYCEVVHWRRNLFLVPSGSVGKAFVRELTRLFNAYAQASALESVAFESITVASCVLLQKPHQSSKSRDHISALERRLTAWRNGNIDELVREGRTIQKQLRAFTTRNLTEEEQDGRKAKIFAKLVFEGKIHSALRYLSDNHGGGVLSLDERVNSAENRSVRDVLRDKHPPKRAASREALVSNTDTPPEVHPVLFERLTGASIRSAALRTVGSAGPSGIDAAGWRRICCSFHKESNDLCAAIATFAKRICTTFVDPSTLRAFVACRLLPLNKNPGVRPIGVCEVIRRIVGKAVLAIVAKDVVQAAGPLQLCAGQSAGCEAAVHAMRKVFNDTSTDAVILVDATNAFNNLNRLVALINIRHLCPSIAIILINCYRSDISLYVGKKVILSQEGTTQGDPLAMAFFALASVPLINAVAMADVTQAWFADDAASGSKLLSLREWWNKLLHYGPKYGYFANAEKSYLLVKPEKQDEANLVFGDTNITVCCTGKRYLGGTLGCEEFARHYLEQKVGKWVEELNRLATMASSEPHAAFAALTHGLIGRWLYAIRVSASSAEDLLKPLEDAIRQKVIPVLTGQPAPNDDARKLLALPARLGGLGIIDPTALAASQKEASEAISAPLVEIILRKHEQNCDSHKAGEDILQALGEQKVAKRRMQQTRKQAQDEEAESVITSLPPAQRESAIVAQEKGVSSWVTAIPVDRAGFTLHKGAFRDALALRYNWPLHHLPQRCTCGETFTVDHALVCRHGGFQIQRHNNLRDLIAALLQEVCTNVETEPQLQPTSGEILGQSANKDDNARLDVRAGGFWGTAQQDAFFDVRVFYPFASSYRRTKLSSLYRQHENKKRREYGQRVREIEHGSFTPLVFTTEGGMAAEATVFVKRLASLISQKRNESYSCVLGWLRCVMSFCLLRSSLVCLRGTRRKQRKVDCDAIAEAVAASKINQ